MKSIEIKAASVDGAIEEALAELQIARDKAEIEVISEGGLFSKAHVKVTEKETPCDRAQAFLSGVMERMNLDCKPQCTESDGVIKVSITGKDSGLAIGYRGEVLDALQYLALLVANKDDGKFEKVVINAENYREKRTRTLEALAKKLAVKACRTRKVIELEPMNPFERRIIHAALADSPYATTESKGEEPNRYVVITPKEKEEYYLKIVSDEVRRLSRLVVAMLNMSKIESGDFEMKPKPYNITDQVIHVLLTFEQKIDKKNIEIRGLDNVQPHYVVADPDMIYQVVYNLFDNAVKFTNENGYIDIQITDMGDSVQCSIKNSGEGIDSTELSRIFERFYKVDKSRSLDAKGAGLGLYIVKTMVEMHGGRIFARSDSKTEAEIVFTLPKQH